MIAGKQETETEIPAHFSSEKLANVKSFHREINSPRLDGFTSNAPLLLVIEPTSRCNFKCVHCSQTYTNRPPADLSLELFQAVVPAMKAALEVYLFGDGEVLLDIPRHLAMIERRRNEFLSGADLGTHAFCGSSAFLHPPLDNTLIPEPYPVGAGHARPASTRP